MKGTMSSDRAEARLQSTKRIAKRLVVFFLAALCFGAMVRLQEWHETYAASEEWAQLALAKDLTWSPVIAATARRMVAVARNAKAGGHPSEASFRQEFVAQLDSLKVEEIGPDRGSPKLCSAGEHAGTSKSGPQAEQPRPPARCRGRDAFAKYSELIRRRKEIDAALDHEACVRTVFFGEAVHQLRGTEPGQDWQAADCKGAAPSRDPKLLRAELTDLASDTTNYVATLQSLRTGLDSRITESNKGLNDAYGAAVLAARPVDGWVVKYIVSPELALRIGDEGSPFHALYSAIWIGLQALCALAVCLVVVPWFFRAVGHGAKRSHEPVVGPGKPEPAPGDDGALKQGYLTVRSWLEKWFSPSTTTTLVNLLATGVVATAVAQGASAAAGGHEEWVDHAAPPSSPAAQETPTSTPAAKGETPPPAATPTPPFVTEPTPTPTPPDPLDAVKTELHGIHETLSALSLKVAPEAERPASTEGRAGSNLLSAVNQVGDIATKLDDHVQELAKSLGGQNGPDDSVLASLRQIGLDLGKVRQGVITDDERTVVGGVWTSAEGRSVADGVWGSASGQSVANGVWASKDGLSVANATAGVAEGVQKLTAEMTPVRNGMTDAARDLSGTNAIVEGAFLRTRRWSRHQVTPEVIAIVQRALPEARPKDKAEQNGPILQALVAMAKEGKKMWIREFRAKFEEAAYKPCDKDETCKDKVAALLHESMPLILAVSRVRR